MMKTLWWKENLTMQGKTTISKTLVLSKIIHMALVTVILWATILELKRSKKDLFGVVMVLKLSAVLCVRTLKWELKKCGHSVYKN